VLQQRGPCRTSRRRSFTEAAVGRFLSRVGTGDDQTATAERRPTSSYASSSSGNPFTGTWPSGRTSTSSVASASVAAVSAVLPGRRELLHARPDVDRGTDRAVVPAEVAADRPHDRLAGVDPDADLDSPPARAARLHSGPRPPASGGPRGRHARRDPASSRASRSRLRAPCYGPSLSTISDFVRKLGANDVIDQGATPSETVVRDIDVVLDILGGTVMERSWSVLRPNGLLVTIVRPPSPEWTAGRAATGLFFIVEPRRAQLHELSRLIDAGTIRLSKRSCRSTARARPMSAGSGTTPEGLVPHGIGRGQRHARARQG
jgi:hypothetical protein